MRRKRKLLLINPINRRRRGFNLDREAMYPPIGIITVASLTPSSWDVEIIDENWEDFKYTEADLVGLTAFTSNVYRAYELAGIYKNAGIPTIIGGIHVSMEPDEAQQYADVVAVGEAEGMWRQILSDFEQNDLKKRYSSGFTNLEKVPIARHDLLPHGYTYSTVQTTRGCPMKCDFCSVHTFNGHTYRQRPIKDVLDELEQVPQQRIFFADDNLVGYSKLSADRTLELFKGMIKRKINKEFICQASMNFGENDEILKYASEAGCRLVFMGIESEKVGQLQESNKKLNLKIGVDNYQKIFDNIHRHGIGIIGAFMFGLESDTLEDIADRAEYIVNSDIDAIQTGILTPNPGTQVFERMTRDDRITSNNYPADWQKYHGFEVVFEHKNMTKKELEDAMIKVWEKIYDIKHMTRQMSNTLKVTGNPKAALWAYATNIHYHNLAFENQNKYIDFNKLLGIKESII